MRRIKTKSSAPFSMTILPVLIGKLFWSKWHQRLGELEVDLLGADALVMQPEHSDEHDMQHTFLFSRAHTIYAGSTEIQRNIVGERVLGLPRE